MNNENPNIVFNPLISCIQKVVLYETRTVSNTHASFGSYPQNTSSYSDCIWWAVTTERRGSGCYPSTD